MSNLQEQIKDAVKNAMREKNKERLGALRLITAAFKQKEVDERIEITDDIALAILDKMSKQLRDSIKQYQEAGRDELAEKEQYELGIVSEFLPAQLTDDEITQLISEAIAATGASSMQDMGKLMGVLKPKLQGRADMGKVSGLVKSQLS